MLFFCIFVSLDDEQFDHSARLTKKINRDDGANLVLVVRRAVQHAHRWYQLDWRQRCRMVTTLTNSYTDSLGILCAHRSAVTILVNLFATASIKMSSTLLTGIQSVRRSAMKDTLLTVARLVKHPPQLKLLHTQAVFEF